MGADPVEPLYESMVLDGGGVRLVERHLLRLARCGVDPDTLRRVALAIRQACDGNLRSCKLRLVVAAGTVEVELSAAKRRVPVDLASVIVYDPHAGHRERKRADRAWATRARRTAVALGADEAVLVSADGLLGETTTTNVFLRLGDGTLVTPAVAGIVPGVVRSWVLEQRRVEVRAVRADELTTARSAFLTTAGRGIVPVARVDGRALEPDPDVAPLHLAWERLPRTAPHDADAAAVEPD